VPQGKRALFPPQIESHTNEADAARPFEVVSGVFPGNRCIFFKFEPKSKNPAALHR
jgi:hypothetical protein